jgi:predicted dehydrogenase
MQAIVKIAAVGLGNRTCKYLRYVAEHQDVAELVAVVDTDVTRFAGVQELFGLPAERCFSSLDELAVSGIEVDACIIGTPDIYHHEMAIKAMRCGWHVLLEKPMAQTQEQCEEIVKVSEETGKMVSVCYVLRYHPYFIKLKELAADPRVGRLLSVKQVEKVGKDRMTHTFVRGPWNKTEMNTSVFFTKCCHDVDFVLWITGDDVKAVSSEHGSKMFTENCAPAGAAERCQDCSIEKECPYSAVDLYQRRRDWIKGFAPMAGESQDEMIARILKESRYGRCVYACPENDVIDRQSVRLEMQSGIKADVIMECQTEETARLTVIECENATISGDESSIEVKYKDGSPAEYYDFQWTRPLELHAGADLLIVQEFIEAIRDGLLKTRTPGSESFVSHKICFLAEK